MEGRSTELDGDSSEQRLGQFKMDRFLLSIWLWGCLGLCLKQVWMKNGKTLSLFISKVIWDTCEWPIEMRRMRIKDKIPISKVMNHHSLKFWNYLCVNSWFFQGLENLFKRNKYGKEWSWVPEWLKSSQILKQCSPKCIQAELLVVNIFKMESELGMEVCNLIFRGKHLRIDMQTVLLKSHISIDRSIRGQWSFHLHRDQVQSYLVLECTFYGIQLIRILPSWVTAIYHHLPSNGM